MKFKDFLECYSIKNKEYRKELKKAFKVISNPCNIITMIKINELGITPLTAVAGELEQVIDCSSVATRQVIGRMVTFVMQQLGYKSLGTRHRLRESTINSTHFKTGTLYVKDDSLVPKYEVKAKIDKACIEEKERTSMENTAGMENFE